MRDKRSSILVKLKLGEGLIQTCKLTYFIMHYRVLYWRHKVSAHPTSAPNRYTVVYCGILGFATGIEYDYQSNNQAVW